MSTIFQNILGSLLVYKYVALFIITFFSSLGIPFPAGSSVIASGAFASQGYFNIFTVLIISFCGNALGDISMFFLSRFYGKRFLEWIHLGRMTETKAFSRLTDVMDRHSARMLIVSRFQDQTTTLVNVIAGLGDMTFKHFCLYALIGDILQILFYSGIGYFFASNWDTLYSTIGVFIWLIIIVTLTVPFFLTRRISKGMIK
jgi:membrane-associated protein